MPLALELTAPALFVAGTTTSLHCALMCGAINAAQLRGHGPVPLPEAVALVHGARVLGYALLGALAGALGGRLALWLPEGVAGAGLQALAALALVVAGVQQLRARRPPARAGGCARRHAPLTRGPVRLRLLAQGLLWALLPCGILYTVLLLAALTTSAFAGFALLGAFGLGTLPLMGLTGGFLGLAARPREARLLRRGAALALVGLGLAGAGLALLQDGGALALLCLPGA